jgi:ABC-type glycerol-3-phosphate transport system substrate-binding protein
MPKSTPEGQLATWLFVRWFAEPEQQARWARVTDYFPVRASAAAQMTDYLAENAGYATAFELLANTRTVPTVAGYDAVRAMVEADAVLPVLDGAPVEEMLDLITASVNEVYYTQFK